MISVLMYSAISYFGWPEDEIENSGFGIEKRKNSFIANKINKERRDNL